MRPEQKQHLIEIYARTLEQFGDTPEAVHWRGVSQRYRFKVLTEIADLSAADVLDYGCGKGDLYPYLLEMGFRGRYTGFDINPELISLAQKKFPGARFAVKDLEEDDAGEPFDYVLMSGIFNNRLADNWGMMTAVLRKAFAVARLGLAFNAISTYVNTEQPEMYYASPEETLRFCLSELSRDVTLKHGEPPFNFGVYVYRRAEWKP